MTMFRHMVMMKAKEESKVRVKKEEEKMLHWQQLMETDWWSVGIVESLDTLRHFAPQKLSAGRDPTKQILHFGTPS